MKWDQGKVQSIRLQKIVCSLWQLQSISQETRQSRNYVVYRRKAILRHILR